MKITTLIKRQKEKRASTSNYILIALYLSVKVPGAPICTMGLILFNSEILSSIFFICLTILDAYISYIFTDTKIAFIMLFLMHIVLNIIFLIFFEVFYLSSPIAY